MNRVVVTGIGAVTPIGNDVESMWKNLIDGRHGIKKISRFDTQGFGCSLAAEVRDYDPLQYMSRKEAARYDAYTVLGVGAASQAVEDSGIIGSVAPERIGVYFSSGVGGLTTLENGVRTLADKGPSRVSPFAVPAMIANTAGGLIAIKYDCRASCMSIITACASSTNAIGEAYRAIGYGHADAIIAGGSDSAINPIGLASFDACRALSKSQDADRASIPFDDDREGFIMGEGGGALVLEEYNHARKRNARIYAEICGYGSTCDAFNIVAPSPDAEGAARAISLALEGVKAVPGRIYINAHGTSTRKNDEMETLAIKKALGEQLAYDSLVSSTKSMTGHLLGGAGAVEAIISILALNRKHVPPTAGYRKADPLCDLDICANESREADVKLALSNSFGFGGHNSCIAFREAE